MLKRNIIESDRKVAEFETRKSNIHLQQLYLTEEELEDWGSARHEGWNKTDVRFSHKGILDVNDLEEAMEDMKEALKLAKQWDLISLLQRNEKGISI